jgi:hypothetical protein
MPGAYNNNIEENWRAGAAGTAQQAAPMNDRFACLSGSAPEYKPLAPMDNTNQRSFSGLREGGDGKGIK